MRLLYASMARLAQSGLVVPPDEADDLVQDFLSRFWERLLARFDPTRSAFATYAQTEFEWHARSWVLDARRWRQKREDVDDAKAAWAASAGDVVAHRESVSTVRAGLRRLPRRTRAVLIEYLSRPGVSERDVAAALRMTRHEVRSLLMDGFGAVLVQFPRPDDIAPDDWDVFRRLYQDQLTVAETARLVGRSWDDVRATRERLLARLRTAGGKSRRPRRRFNRGVSGPAAAPAGGATFTTLQTTKGMDMSDIIARELKEAIVSRDAGRLAAVARRIEGAGREPLELFEALAFSDSESARLSEEPEWMARVYGTLGGDASGDAAAAAAAGESFRANEAALDSVGRAFDDILLRGLPDDLRRLRHVRDLPRASPDERAGLLARADVRAAERSGELLAGVGVGPVAFLLATDALGSLVRGLSADGGLSISGDRPLRIYRGGKGTGDGRSLTFREVAVDVAHVAGLDLPTSPEEADRYEHIDQVPLPRSEAVLNWLLDASVSKPKLFPGLEADAAGGRDALLELRPAPWIESYQERWSITGPAAPLTVPARSSSPREPAGVC